MYLFSRMFLNIILSYNVGALKKIEFLNCVLFISGKIILLIFLLRLKYNSESLMDLLLIKLKSDIIFNISKFN